MSHKHESHESGVCNQGESITSSPENLQIIPE